METPPPARQPATWELSAGIWEYVAQGNSIFPVTGPMPDPMGNVHCLTNRKIGPIRIQRVQAWRRCTGAPHGTAP